MGSEMCIRDSPNLVLNDVLDGLIDRETAKKTYGVVIKNNRLNKSATEAARKMGK